MLLLIRYELLKTFRKWRTYIGFLLVLILVPLIYWGLSLSGDSMIKGMTQGLQKNFMFVGSLFNGWFVAHMVMNTLIVHVPLLIVLVSGDLFAGEASAGTFRILLTRPPSRTRIFNVKLFSTIIYVGLFISFLALYTTLLGYLWFGGGSLLSMHPEGIVVHPEHDVWWRFLIAYLLAGWAMCTVASLGLLLSTLVENAIGPIVGFFAILILFLILGNLPFEFFESIKPYLFTSYLDIWRLAFHSPIDTEEMMRQSGKLSVFFVVFTTSAWIIFKKKNVLS
jgi:ABC-2 type transport system permease protein